MKNYVLTTAFATAPGETIIQDVVLVTVQRQEFSTPYSQYIMFDCNIDDFETDEDVDDYCDDYKLPYLERDEEGIYHC